MMNNHSMSGFHHHHQQSPNYNMALGKRFYSTNNNSALMQQRELSEIANSQKSFANPNYVINNHAKIPHRTVPAKINMVDTSYTPVMDVLTTMRNMQNLTTTTTTTPRLNPWEHTSDNTSSKSQQHCIDSSKKEIKEQQQPCTKILKEIVEAKTNMVDINTNKEIKQLKIDNTMKIKKHPNKSAKPQKSSKSTGLPHKSRNNNKTSIKNHIDDYLYPEDISYNHDEEKAEYPSSPPRCRLKTKFSELLTAFLPSVAPCKPSFSWFISAKSAGIQSAVVSSSGGGGVVRCKERLPSECRSEDSFVVFASDSDTDDDCFKDETSEEEDSDLDSEEGDGESTCEEELDGFEVVEMCGVRGKKESQKKVSFQSFGKLCVIHTMVQWSFAYRAARKGPWEEYGRDRERFKTRIAKVAPVLNEILSFQHRTEIYKHRFQNNDAL